MNPGIVLGAGLGASVNHVAGAGASGDLLEGVQPFEEVGMDRTGRLDFAGIIGSGCFEQEINFMALVVAVKIQVVGASGVMERAET